MEITKSKAMYVGVDEVGADWGVARSKGYAIMRLCNDGCRNKWRNRNIS